MSTGQFDTPFDLSTACNGDLNRDFLEEVAELLPKIPKGQKGTITMKVDLSRLADADTLVATAYSINSTKPAKKVSSYANIKQDKNNQLSLMTDEPVVHMDNVTAFEVVNK